MQHANSMQATSKNAARLVGSAVSRTDPSTNTMRMLFNV